MTSKYDKAAAFDVLWAVADKSSGDRVGWQTNSLEELLVVNTARAPIFLFTLQSGGFGPKFANVLSSLHLCHNECTLRNSFAIEQKALAFDIMMARLGPITGTPNVVGQYSGLLSTTVEQRSLIYQFRAVSYSGSLREVLSNFTQGVVNVIS